jgi:hypothetical protein
MGGPVTGHVFTSVALGTWGRPPDVVAWAALGVSIVLALLSVAPKAVHEFVGLEAASDRDQRRRVVAASAFVAAFLSLGYVAFYLRGAPRIIDATSYFLEARALAHGKFAWAVPSPTASFRGRFLLFHDPASVAVIFPPGYPLLLAAGFLVGAPMVVGPVLAAALVGATFVVTRELYGPEDPRADGVAALASTFSIVCAALRYHTADTMAHGASALGITIALACALCGRRRRSVVYFVLAGLAVGWVIATRPVSGVPIAVVVYVLAAGSDKREASLASAILATLPGLVLLGLAQRADTGNFLASAQRAYYAVSDGPPGCFRYGFGKDTGCLNEHGDFVKAHLTSGFGWRAALGTTGRRLKAHLTDGFNFEPLLLLVLVPSLKRVGSRAGLALALVVAQIVAYAPFYFDGNYPGAGARMFADVLPMEHALAAIAVSYLAPQIALLRRGLFVLALACAGFAVHTVFDHIALADRDGGRPMYEPDAAREAQVTKGLLFFDTDEGFNLAHVPGANPDKDIVAARLHNDDHDRMLLDQLKHPVSHVYRFAKGVPTVSLWVPPGGNSDLWRFEAEADWPPLAQTLGWVEPAWLSGTCASQERALELHPSSDATASATIELPVAKGGRWLVTPRIVRSGGHGKGTLRLVPMGRAPLADDAKLVWDWADEPANGPPRGSHEACVDLVPREAQLLAEAPGAGARWILTATGGTVTLDRTTMRLLH